jgi:hypothetical protein
MSDVLKIEGVYLGNKGNGVVCSQLKKSNRLQQKYQKLAAVVVGYKNSDLKWNFDLFARAVTSYKDAICEVARLACELQESRVRARKIIKNIEFELRFSKHKLKEAHDNLSIKIKAMEFDNLGKDVNRDLELEETVKTRIKRYEREISELLGEINSRMIEVTNLRKELDIQQVQLDFLNSSVAKKNNKDNFKKAVFLEKRQKEKYHKAKDTLKTQIGFLVKEKKLDEVEVEEFSLEKVEVVKNAASRKVKDEDFSPKKFKPVVIEGGKQESGDELWYEGIDRIA